MSDRTKRILIIVGFILSVIAIATALYVMFFRTSPTQDVADTPTTAEEFAQLPLETLQRLRDEAVEAEQALGDGRLEEADTVARGGITQTTELTTGAVYNTTLSTSGDAVNYYNETDGRFYTINEEGETVALSDAQFPNAETVEWNNDAEKVVIEFPDGSNIVYDFVTEDQVTLPAHWEGFNFSPVQDEIAAKSVGLDPNNRWLVITDSTGASTQPIQALGDNADKVDVNWSPNDQVVAFANTAGSTLGGLDRTVIYPVGKNKENFKGLVVEGIGFDSRWSPTGKQLLYSVTGSYSNDKPLLWIVDATANTMGDNRQSLGLNTWVDKCTWGSSSDIYCAVPVNLPANAGLARDIYRDEPDALYHVDLTTGRTSLLGIPAEETSMDNLNISNDGASLYFTNSDGQLELMRLK